MAIKKEAILSIFQKIERCNIRYVLLRNINNELPEQFERNKDIDILVHEDDRDRFRKTLMEEGWKQVRHPWDFGDNFVFLYAMTPVEFFEKEGIYLDICYQLCCRSVNAGEWMPVDQLINDSVWENKRRNSQWDWYELGAADQLVHLLTRSIFDKKKFEVGYIKEIEKLLNIADIHEVRLRLKWVFFNYTDMLLKQLREGQYDHIIINYHQFCEY